MKNVKVKCLREKMGLFPGVRKGDVVEMTGHGATNAIRLGWGVVVEDEPEPEPESTDSEIASIRAESLEKLTSVKE